MPHAVTRNLPTVGRMILALGLAVAGFSNACLGEPSVPAGNAIGQVEARNVAEWPPTHLGVGAEPTGGAFRLWVKPVSDVQRIPHAILFDPNRDTAFVIHVSRPNDPVEALMDITLEKMLVRQDWDPYRVRTMQHGDLLWPLPKRPSPAP